MDFAISEFVYHRIELLDSVCHSVFKYVRVKSPVALERNATHVYALHKNKTRELVCFACFADEMDPTFRVCAEILKHFEKKIFSKC